MTDEFFPNFERATLALDSVSYFARIGGPADAPAVALLHGFPQTHESWHAVAPALAEHFRVVCLDSKGYGRSDAPVGDSRHEAYSKRSLGRELAQLMSSLGHHTFAVAGHDRGALVGYRLALDEPETVSALVVLDNYPTSVIWDYMATEPSFTPHWRTYALPYPQAEQAMTPEQIENLVRVHTADGTLDSLDPRALAAYQSTWDQPDRIHAFCEDYRAGATIDPDLDRADLEAGRVVSCPTLILWGEKFLGAAPERADDIWRRTFAPEAVGVEVPGGHFNPEESPEATTNAMRDFLSTALCD